MSILTTKRPLVILVLLYLLTRLVNLTLLPVFSDEALYLDWGWQAIHIPGKLWHPLTDAKQPFLIWLFGLGQTVFPDPLVGARLVSVFTGLLTLFGLWRLCSGFFEKKVASLCSLLYILSPIFLFFDRQALMESALAACAVWSLYFLLKLLATHKYHYSILLGLSLGLGLFTKNTAVVFLFTSLVIITVYYFTTKRIQYPISVFLTLTVFTLVNLPLFFQGLYWQTLSTNSRWSFAFSELVRLPVRQWFTNLLGSTQIAFLFLTPLVFISSLFGLRQFIKSQSAPQKVIVLWFLASLVILLITLRFMNFMSFRYLVPFLPPALILAAVFLSSRPKLLLASLFIPAVLSLLLLINPVGFFKLDSGINAYSYTAGYVTGADTGYQVNALVNYFRSLSSRSPINVTTAVHTFNPESGVWTYLRKSPNITLAYLDGRLLGDTGNLSCITADRPTYFLAKLDDTVGLSNFLDKVTVITNPYNSDYSTIYKLKENCSGPSASLTIEQNR